VTPPPFAGPPSSSDAGRSGPEEIHDGLPPAPEEPGGRRGIGRGIVLAGAAAGVVVLGGTGYAVASYLSGGGAQPEEALPADTLAFAKLDLDPAANQKTAVASLLDRFPDVVEGGGDGDLRGTLVQPLLEGNAWGLTYDRDVEPWLGDRMAVAAVPDPGSAEGVAAVVVLAVTDQDEMTDRLGAVQADDFAFAVRDDFVLIGQTQETVDRVAAAGTTLDQDEEYRDDRDALDGDQVAVAWADLAGLQDVVGAMAPAGGMAGLGGVVPGGVGLADQALTGRIVLGLHAEPDALEVQGLTRGVAPDDSATTAGPTRLVQDLPEDTLAALSVSGLGDALAAAWAAPEGAGIPPEFQQQIAALGLQLPDDLRTVLGSDLALAVSGDLAAPQFGARVVTEDPQRAVEVLTGVLGSPEVGLPAAAVPLADGYALATDPAFADALGRDGGLGDSEAFRAAVADPDEAQAVGFVDLGALVDQVIAQGGDSAAEAERFRAVEALGFSATGSGDEGRFVLRVTTR
jgi:hypothetical protein